ncbi:MAG: cell division protein FtsK, partial [Chloroflexia bacterium]|nr:cell division protein FtsK [Chloroflexia bacterium]
MIIMFVNISWEGETLEMVRQLLERLKNIEMWSEVQLTRVAENHQQRLAEIERQFEMQETECKQTFSRQIVEWAGAAIDFEKQTSHLSPAWDDPAWEQWTLPATPVLALRVGSFQPTFFENFPLPVSVDFPGSRALMFQAGGALKAPAVAAIQSLILRLLATIPPGRVQFTFIDPIGLGQNVAPFMSLTDHNEALVAGKAWSEPRHIEQQLTALTEHMENVIQKYLRHKYATIEEYNHEAGEIAEPYKVLVVLDFPVNFHDETVRRLLSIAQHGPRCGVFTVILVDTEKPQTSGVNFAELEQASTVISTNRNQDGFVIEDAELKVFDLVLDTLPNAALIHHITEQVGKASLSASKVEVLFERIAPRAPTWDADHDLNLLEVPMGPSGAQKFQSFTLGAGTAHHALVVGQTGSGKSNLLHVLITGIAMKYSPDDVQMYLLDFKKGVEFKAYADGKLPHARVVAIESEREFGLSVLVRLDDELRRRGDRFRG